MKQKESDDCRRAGFHDVGRRHAATRAGDRVHLQQAWRDLVANGMGSIGEAGRQAENRDGSGACLRIALPVEMELAAA